MDNAAVQVLLDNIFDQAMVYHGFTDYMRDYELSYVRPIHAPAYDHNTCAISSRPASARMRHRQFQRRSGRGRWTKGSLTTRQVWISTATSGVSSGRSCTPERE
jgi:hypothetical protein